jgi:hypothetical protein
MSAPITEAHLRLANQIVASPPSPLVMATLIADSEAEAVQTAMLREYGNLCATNESLAKERDQLRADCENETKWAAHYLADAQNASARADRAEAELGKLQELHGCSQGMVVHWCAHAAERSQGLDQARAELAAWHLLRLWGTTPEIVHEFIKGQQARIHAAQDIEAELAAERARLDYLSTRGFEHRHHETGDHLAYEWTISSTDELKDVSLREVIDAAMKEGAK